MFFSCCFLNLSCPPFMRWCFISLISLLSLSHLSFSLPASLHKVSLPITKNMIILLLSCIYVLSFSAFVSFLPSQCVSVSLSFFASLSLMLCSVSRLHLSFAFCLTSVSLLGLVSECLSLSVSQSVCWLLSHTIHSVFWNFLISLLLFWTFL